MRNSEQTKGFPVCDTGLNRSLVFTKSSGGDDCKELHSRLESGPIDEGSSSLPRQGANSQSARGRVNEHRRDYQKKLKTEICKVYQLGFKCPYGDECCFAHGASELKHKDFASERYKTIRCIQFHKKSYCQYGSRCNFIHRQGKKNGVKKIKLKYQQILACLQRCYEALEIKKREELFLNLIHQSFIKIFKVPKLSVFESLRS